MTLTLAFVLAFLAAAAALPLLAAHHLARLPYAPECPHCRSVTGPPAHTGVADRLWASVAATPVRTCGRCGWAGRMRWKVAAERAGRIRRG